MSLILISVLPVIILAFYIYNKDKEKEPTELLIKLFFGGAGSVFIAAVIYLFLNKFFPIILTDDYGVGFLSSCLRVFFSIGLVEEFSKWIILYHISYDHYEFDQVFDMIVYSAFVALGFACIENIFYVYEHGAGVGFARAFSAVPAHFFFGIFMGYYLSMAKLSSVKGDYSLELKYKVFSILVPALLHSIYDSCLFMDPIFYVSVFDKYVGLNFIIFLGFVIVLYIVSFSRIKYSLRYSGKLRYKNKFCPNCGTPVKSDCCPGCGCRNE